MNYIYRFDIAAIIISICVFVIFYRERTVKTKFVRAFTIIFFLILMVNVTDLTCILMLMNPQKYPLALLYFAKIFYQIFYHSAPICFFLWMYYGTQTEKNSYSKKQQIIIGIPYLFSLLMIFTTVFTHAILYFDEQKVYHHGKLIFILYGEAAFYLIFGVIRVIKNRKVMTPTTRRTIYFYSLLCLLGVIVQVIKPAWRITGFALVVSVLLGYFTLDNPSDYIDKELNLMNRKGLLTNLNRFAFTDNHLELISLKIEGLKNIREVLGRENQIILLQNIVEYLESSFGYKNLYRIADDIFVAQLEVDHEQRLRQLLELQKRFKESFKCGNNDIRVDILINLINYPEDSKNVMEIVDFLENAFSDRVFSEKINIHYVNRTIIERRHRKNHIAELMEKALLEDSKGYLKIVYQPIYSVRLHKFNVVEALVRLYDPELGEIMPEEFIPIAEESGLILRLGNYVLRKVCEFVTKNALSEHGVEHISINLSIVQCLQENLYEQLSEVIDDYSINFQYIYFEITESVTKLSNEIIKDNMIKFKNKNISFIMDCYGNQNTNLVDLVEYPFTVVKIDRNFAWYAMENEKAKKILEEMIIMLKSVKKKVVVVGIETPEQAAAFTKMGSDYLQGFYFSKPLPPEEFMAFIKKS